LCDILHNPVYAGFYVFGRRPTRRVLVGGEVKKRRVRLEDRSDALVRLAPEGLSPPIARADEVNRPLASPLADPMSTPNRGHPRNARIIPKSRDFH